MTRAMIAAGRRMNILSAPVAHAAGDFVYYNGFYGLCQDDWVAGRPAVLIMDAGEVYLKNVFGSNLNPGVKVYAAPSAIATTLAIYPAISVPSGANPVGRVTATSGASLATAVVRVAIFHPNAY